MRNKPMQIIYFIKELFIQLFSCFFGKRITKENAAEILAEKEANYAMARQALKDSLDISIRDLKEMADQQHEKEIIKEMLNDSIFLTKKYHSKPPQNLLKQKV